MRALDELLTAPENAPFSPTFRSSGFLDPTGPETANFKLEEATIAAILLRKLDQRDRRASKCTVSLP
jgi:hypothetical protein